MQELVKIIKCLKRSEVHFIKEIYKIRKFAKSSNSKRLKLFKAILSDKIKNNKDAAYLLFNKPPDSALFHLKKRLKDDILNFIILLPNKNLFEVSVEIAEHDCRKKLIQSNFLISRGVYEEAIYLLKEVIKLSDKFELPHLKNVANDIIKSTLVFENGTLDYFNYEIKTGDDLGLIKEIVEANSFNSIATNTSNLENENSEVVLEKFQRELISLKLIFDKTNYSRIGFRYLLLAIYLFSIKKNYVKVYEYANQLRALIYERPAIRSSLNKAMINLEMAKILIHLTDFKSAIVHASKAQYYILPGTAGELYILEKLFYAYFYNKQFQDADDTLTKVFNNHQLKINHDLLKKWLFFKAALKFIAGDHKESIRFLNSYSYVMKGKFGIMSEYRILELLNLLELENLDQFEYKLECFRRSIYRANVKNRFYLTYRILNSIKNSDYNFRIMYRKEEENIDLLKKAEGNFSRDHFGFELITVDEWLDQKIAEKSSYMII